MGLAERHAYRFGYLQSEHWQNLRIEKLAQEDAKCFICGKRDMGNDVHHVHYPEDLHSVSLDILRVLCREHHERIHELVDAMKADDDDDPPESKIGSDFKRFRLACKTIESELRAAGLPCRTGNGRVKGANYVPMAKSETDKCPHSVRMRRYALVRKLSRIANLIDHRFGELEFVSQEDLNALPEDLLMDYRAVRVAVDNLLTKSSRMPRF